MPPKPGPVGDHRADREAGAIVYPVYSRRSDGLSIGINLFPDAKLCSFDCPYCEVFPFATDLRFSLAAMERGLRVVVAHAKAQDVAIRDFCFSGNGEPTLSPEFEAALSLASRLKGELCPRAALVVISNGSRLVEPAFADYLAQAIRDNSLDLWLKVDAGTEAWYRAINRSALPFNQLVAALRAFSLIAPFTVQTMLCTIGGNAPSKEEAQAWVDLAASLCLGTELGAQRYHLYGKARPAPEDPLAAPLDKEFLKERAYYLSEALSLKGCFALPVEVYE